MVLLFLPVLSQAGDLGFILDQNIGYEGAGDYNTADYVASLIPRYSTLLGDNGTLSVSAGFSMQYERENWTFIPELLRSEITWVSGRWDITAGRMYYSDPLGLIAEGLFDGALFSYDIHWGTLSAGLWYTGLLYKKRANIAMNAEEWAFLNTGLEYSKFTDTYFAPSRMVAALDWEQPADMFKIKVSLLGQFDQTGENLDSQYLTAKLSIPADSFFFDFGGSLSFLHNARDDFNIAWAGELQAAWMLPVSFASRLSLLWRHSSGTAENGIVTAFIPITTKTQGSVIKTNFTSISIISLDYLARLHRNCAVNLKSTYYIRTDLDVNRSYLANLYETQEGHFIGNEFYARVIWNPASDMQVNLGTGLFLPALGNVAPKTDVLWRAELNLVLSLY